MLYTPFSIPSLINSKSCLVPKPSIETDSKSSTPKTSGTVLIVISQSSLFLKISFSFSNSSLILYTLDLLILPFKLIN